MTGNENDETGYLLSSKTNAARLRESVNQLAEMTIEDLLVEIEQRAISNDDDFRKLLELWQKLLGETAHQVEMCTVKKLD